MLLVRNPWGSEKYSGDWSDSDTRWALKSGDRTYREIVRDFIEGHEPGLVDDGLFYMDLDSYMANFS